MHGIACKTKYPTFPILTLDTLRHYLCDCTNRDNRDRPLLASLQRQKASGSGRLALWLVECAPKSVRPSDMQSALWWEGTKPCSDTWWIPGLSSKGFRHHHHTWLHVVGPRCTAWPESHDKIILILESLFLFKNIAVQGVNMSFVVEWVDV